MLLGVVCRPQHLGDLQKQSAGLAPDLPCEILQVNKMPRGSVKFQKSCLDSMFYEKRPSS